MSRSTNWIVWDWLGTMFGARIEGFAHDLTHHCNGRRLMSGTSATERDAPRPPCLMSADYKT